MKQTILVVEDDRLLREVLCMELEFSAECRVLNAEGVKQAQRVLAQNTVDLVISDVMMPDGNGYDLVESARKGPNPKLPVILMSGLLDEELAKLHKDGVTAVVSKPFDAERLLALVRDILGVCPRTLTEPCAEPVQPSNP